MASYDNVQLPGAPSPGTYAPSPIDFSSLAQIPKQLQESQEYAVKRGLQTMYQDGNYPTYPDGSINYGKIAQDALKVGGPAAAQPYFNMMMQQQSARDFNEINQPDQGGQPQGQSGRPQQNFTPLAPNSATGPDGIRGRPQTLNTGGGSIFPLKPGETNETIMADSGGADDGMGVSGQPAPFAGNRDQQGAPSQPQIAFNDRIPPGGGMSNRPTVTEDGSTGQPAAPTSARETSNNGVANDPVIKRQQAIIDKYTNFLGRHMQVLPGQENAAKASIATAQKAIEQRTDFLNKNAELTTEQKNIAGGDKSAKVQGALADSRVKASDNEYAGLRGQEIQYQRNNGPAIGTAKGILQNPKMYAGFGADTVLDFNKVRTAFGGDAEPAALQEALKKVTAINLLSQFNDQRAQLEEQGQQSGRMFAAQVQPLMDASSSVGNTIKGNLFLANYQDKIGKYQSDLASMARTYRAQHNGLLGDGFDNQVAAYMKAKPIFTPQEQANPLLLASPDAPKTVKDRATAHAWAQTMGLKSGDSIRLPNGTYASVP
jgi:hypothetical protein